MSNLKTQPWFIDFCSTIICVHPLKKTPLHKQEFLLVFLTRFPSTFQLNFRGSTVSLPFPGVVFFFFTDSGIWIHGCLRPLFFGGWKLCGNAPQKKNEAKKDLDEVTCWADGEAILTQMACLAFWSSAKIASWLLTVLDFKFQSGFFSQIPPNAPFFFPWFLQLLSREMFRSGNIRRSCVEKLDKLWCWCLAEQTWYATK